MQPKLFSIFFLGCCAFSSLAQEPSSIPVVTPPVLRNNIVAPYPPAALAADIEGVVLLELVIAPDGTVVEAIIKESAGFGFDEAALSAAKQFVFTPAQKNGAPAASRLPYRYRFSLQPKGKASPGAAPIDPGDGRTPSFILGQPSVGPSAAGALSGIVKAQGSKRPVKATLYAVSAPLPEALSKDEALDWIMAHLIASIPTEGPTEHFFLEGVPAGEFYLVILPEGAYEPLQYSDVLQPYETIELNFNVTAASKEDYGITVRAEAKEPQVIKRSIQKDEILQGAGTQGDALRAITNLPGLARAPLSSGLLVVRGSSPEDTRAQLLGAWVPQLYHLTGGTAVLNTELIQQIDFYPGAYGARYGRVNGGVIEVTPGTGDPESLRASVDVDVFDAGVVMRGPLGARSSFAVAARRSYVDTLLPVALDLLEVEDVSLQTAPRSWDYEGLYQFHPTKDSTLRILGLGSGDGVKLLLQEDSGEVGLLNGTVEGESRQHLLLVSYDEKRGKATRQATLAFLLFNFSGSLGPEIDGSFAQNGLTARYIEDRELWRGAILGFGGDLFASRINAGGVTFLPPLEGEESPPLGIDPAIEAQVDGFKWTDAGLFTELKQSIGPLTLIPGVRLDRMGGTKELMLQPRGGVTYDLNPETRLRTSVGTYAQDPIAFELDKNLGNPNLSPERTFQIAAGGHHDFTRWQLDLDGFYKKFSDVVTRRGSGFTAAEVTSNGGEGWAWGVEVLAKIPAGKKLSGWVAYTYSRSLRVDAPGEELRSFDFDQPHVFTALGTYKLPKRWTLSGRWRFASGNPQTPIDGAIFDSDLDVYIPVPGAVNSLRDPSFHQLDLKIDRAFSWDQWELTFYLDLQNVYNQKNAEGIAHNFDYSRSALFTGLPILPSLGLTGTFVGMTKDAKRLASK